jgi:hypothetical protein
MQYARYCAIALLTLMMVASTEGAEPFPSSGITATLRFFMELDSNEDNRVSEREYVGSSGGKQRSMARRDFRSLDDNGDGWLSVGEYSDRDTRRRARQ